MCIETGNVRVVVHYWASRDYFSLIHVDTLSLCLYISNQVPPHLTLHILGTGPHYNSVSQDRLWLTSVVSKTES